MKPRFVDSFFNYDPSFDSNSILAYETGNISFYVVRVETAEARAAVRAESFSVPGWAEYPSSTVPVDSFVISHLPSAVAFMTVTVFRAGAWRTHALTHAPLTRSHARKYARRDNARARGKHAHSPPLPRP